MAITHSSDGTAIAYEKSGMGALAEVLPNAERRTLDGQNHMVKAAALAPVLTNFFRA
jgi:hypothetical protein